MNFLQLVQRLHRETLRTTAAPSTVANPNDRHARLVDRVADAWRELQAERDWKWMRGRIDAPLTASVQAYSGTDLGAVRFRRWRDESPGYSAWVYVDGSVNTLSPLCQRDIDGFRVLWVYREMGQTRPIEWAHDESHQLLVGPVPASGFSIRADYWKSPSELVGDADEPDMPDEFVRILVWRALMNCGRDDAAPEILAKAETEYARLHSALVLDQARLPTLG